MAASTHQTAAGLAQRPVKIGLVLPQVEGMMAGATARWSDLVLMAQRAEALGFDSLWVIDHLLFDGIRQAGRREGLWECWSLLAALAAATSRVQLGSLVSCTGFRQPTLLAKIADTVDEISAGRLIVGLGAGWYDPEYRAFGYPTDHRISRFEEALIIVRSLLQDGQVDYTGSYYDAAGCELRPRSARRGGPPILVGALAHAPRMLRLTARYADLWNGWLAFGRSYADQMAPLQAKVDAACRAAGRDPETLTRTAGVLIDVTHLTRGPHEAVWVPGGNLFGPFEPLTGSPEDLAEAVRDFARAGVTHLQVWLAPNTLAGIEALAPVLELLDNSRHALPGVGGGTDVAVAE